MEKIPLEKIIESKSIKTRANKYGLIVLSTVKEIIKKILF